MKGTKQFFMKLQALKHLFFGDFLHFSSQIFSPKHEEKAKFWCNPAVSRISKISLVLLILLGNIEKDPL